MSLIVTQWAWQTPSESLSKLILLALADYADPQGNCYSSLNNLAKKCGLSRSTICLHLKKLWEGGYLAVSQKFTESGLQYCNHYQLQIDINQNKTSPRFGNHSPRHVLDHVREKDRNYINSKGNVMGPLKGPNNGESQKKISENKR